MNDKYLNSIHEEILSIMDEVDKICKKHDIEYFMIGGTLLGAIRHNGFIPWDDDFDIAMPRKDFNKFISIVKNDLDKEFKLAWITTNNKYRHLYAKIEKRNTIFYEGLKYNENEYPGIFIDIFPLDDNKKYSKIVEVKKYIVKKISIIMGIKVIDNTLKAKILKIIPTKILYFVAEKIMTISNNKNYTWYTNYGSQYNVKKQTIKKECFHDKILTSFNNRIYYAPKKYDDVLLSIYGDNYMIIPPKEKRSNHYPKYVKFSNGEEYWQ